MKKTVYALACTILITLACGTSNIAPTPDSNIIQTAIVSTALAAQNQTQSVNPPNDNPTLTNTPDNNPVPANTSLPTVTLEPNAESGNILGFLQER